MGDNPSARRASRERAKKTRETGARARIPSRSSTDNYIPVDAEGSGSGKPGRALDWETAKGLPWEILILFGGGLSLASAIVANGVDGFIGAGFAGLAGLPPWVLVLTVAAVVVLLTEITSNTAVTTTLMPVLAATAAATAVPPGMLLTAAALAASCAFMLPVATPPNAIVFASGRVTIGQMARAGIGLKKSRRGFL